MEVHVQSLTGLDTLGRHTCNSSEPSIQNIVNEIFSGEPPLNSVNMQYAPQIKVSDGNQLGSTISQKVKEKNWANEFIELNMLSPHYECDQFSLYIHIPQSSNTHVVHFSSM